MREIEFKIIEKTTKDFDFVTIDNEFDCHTGWLDNCVLLQYTGLTDKNGVKIYEGDQMTHPDFDYDAVLTVKFNEGCFCLNCWECTNTDFSKGEVIGNIHDKK